jgi:hypothetical protein
MVTELEIRLGSASTVPDCGAAKGYNEGLFWDKCLIENQKSRKGQIFQAEGEKKAKKGPRKVRGQLGLYSSSPSERRQRKTTTVGCAGR